MISVENLGFARGGKKILDGVTFEWSSGLLALIGKNGSGKSTLLRCLASTLTPTAGIIRWNGQPIDQRLGAYRGLLGYAPQGRELRSRLTATEFLVTCASLRRLRARQMVSEALHVLTLVGLETFAHTPLNHLSGGNLRRLLTAQALMGNPKLVLLDEPTSEVDEAASKTIWDLIARHSRTHPVIVASHHLAAASIHADGIITVDAGAASGISKNDRRPGVDENNSSS
jgi:ABC-2 type transport system ATP-binding protein